MIKGYELRKGNLVTSVIHNLKYATFECILPSSSIVLLKEVSTYDFLEKLAPIALTPDVLERIPWTAGSFVIEVPYGRVCLKYRSGVLFFQRNETAFVGLNVNSLHHFQNVFLDITGEQLDIKF